jgi:hypothetical protein
MGGIRVRYVGYDILCCDLLQGCNGEEQQKGECVFHGYPLSNFMNCTDVVVVEWRGCLRFPNETPLFFSTATELDEQKLKGYKAVEFEILRAITL